MVVTGEQFETTRYSLEAGRLRRRIVRSPGIRTSDNLCQLQKSRVLQAILLDYRVKAHVLCALLNVMAQFDLLHIKGYRTLLLRDLHDDSHGYEEELRLRID